MESSSRGGGGCDMLIRLTSPVIREVSRSVMRSLLELGWAGGLPLPFFLSLEEGREGGFLALAGLEPPVRGGSLAAEPLLELEELVLERVIVGASDTFLVVRREVSLFSLRLKNRVLSSRLGGSGESRVVGEGGSSISREEFGLSDEDMQQKECHTRRGVFVQGIRGVVSDQ